MEPETAAPEFAEAIARSALVSAGARLGLVTEAAQLMRLGENALFRLSPQPEPLVARIARTMAYWTDAVKEVAVASWLNNRGIPAAQTTPHRPQPIEAAGHPVTLWRWIEGRPAVSSETRQLGALLRRLHDLSPPDLGEVPLSRLNPLERVRPRIENAAITEGDRSFLLDEYERLCSQWQSLDLPSGLTVIHGDAHIKNVMMTGPGPTLRPVLIDLERFAVGPREWDLAKTATEYLTAGFYTAAEYQAFCDGYGVDVTRWSGFSTMQQTMALSMTTWLMQNVRDSDRTAAEFAKRMRTLRGSGPAGNWAAH